MILFSWKINLTLFFFVILPKEIPKLRLIVLKIKIVYLYSKLISTTDTDYDYLQGTEPVFSICCYPVSFDGHWPFTEE